jgi:hypothetical protein
MTRSALAVTAAAILLAGTAGCGIVSSWQPHVRTSSSEPSLPRTGPSARPSPGAPGVRERPGTSRAPHNVDDRRICRSSSTPRGWIAVAYVSAPEQCPARPGADSTANAASVAVLARYLGLPLGAVLDVCADQPTPNGWGMVTDEPVDDATSCPGAVRGGGSTTKRIRRNR